MVHLLDEDFVELHNEFVKFDSDSDGIVTLNDFKRVFSSVYPKMKPVQIAAAFNQLDFLGNQRITYSNFLTATIDKTHF